MQLVLKAIMPRPEEVIGYFLVGLLVVLVLNCAEIVDIVFAASQTDMDVQATVNNSIVGVIRDVATPLNGRLGNSVVWAFMGIIAFGLGSIAVAELQDMIDHNEEAHETPRRFRGGVWEEFLIRTGLRTLALIGLIIWVYLFFAYISPVTSRALLESLLAPDGLLWAGLMLLVSGAVFGLSMYVIAVLSRFIALRVRIFSDRSV